MSVTVETRPVAIAPGRRILLLPADRTGCGLYRMVMPRRAAKQYYPDVVIAEANAMQGKVERDDRGRPHVISVPAPEHDVIVFQRPYLSKILDSIPLIQAQGAAVVVELDDDVRQLDPRNQAFDGSQPKDYNFESNWQNIVEACRLADWVTVSTPALKWYAPHGRVTVIPNTVPPSTVSAVIPPRPPGWPVTVGWPGSIGTHPGDLDETVGQVASVVAETGAHFHIIGDGQGVKEALRLPDRGEGRCDRCGGTLAHGVCATGWVQLMNYPDAVAHLDVGIVPLSGSKFNVAKSWLKGLEMASLGIPFVASPTPEYLRLRDEHGVGQIAHRPGDWRKLLRPLIEDEEYRIAVGNDYRAKVAAGLLIDHVVDLWVGAWESAYQYRQTLNG